MAVIKVRDLAYGRLRSPDLDMEEEFLTAFGMVRAARTPTALYMRAQPGAPYPCHGKGRSRVHWLCVGGEQRGPTQSCLKVAWRVGHREHRRTRWRQAGRLVEPNGYAIEVVTASKPCSR